MAQLADDDVDRLALPLLVRAANLLHESFVITTSGDDGRGYRVLFVNDEFTRMTGYGREEVLGRTLGFLQGAETDPAEIERLDRELAAGEDFDGRAINYRKDGSQYLVEWSIRGIRDESGRVTHFFSVQRDVSSEDEARLRHERLRLAIEQMTDPVVVFDPDGRVTDVNRALGDWLAAPAETAIGRKVWRLPGRPSAREDLVWARRRLTAGIPWQRTYTSVLNLHGEPTRRIVFTSASPLRDGKRIIGYVAVSRDVTERARLEGIAASVNLNDKLGMAFAGLRHELGNPVNSLKSALTVVRSGSISEQRQRRYLDAMAAQVERIEYLLDNLRTFGVFDRMRLDDLDLGRLVARVADLVRQDLEERGVTLEIEVPPGLEVRGSSQALLHVLLNLISNAAEAVATQPQRRILLSARPTVRHRVLIEITDTGPGIPADDVNRIFAPFFSTREGGTGLGLAIVQKLVTAMRGTIEARSVGRGATFGIVLDRPPTGVR